MSRIATYFIGSIFFTTAAWLQVLAATGPRLVVATLNMVGSGAFGLSAVAAKVLSDGSPRNAQLANTGMWVGGACFLLGAIFLIPEELAFEPASAGR